MYEPTIYAACLASYNAHALHGRWIDCESAEHIQSEIDAMLAESPQPNAEEYAIHDYDLGGIQIGEFESIESVMVHADMLREQGAVWAAYCDIVGTHYATPDGFENDYLGEYESKLDWAYHDVDANGEIPDWIANYFDYDAWIRDAECNGISFARLDGGTLAVFRSI